jgi:hypothetical protein
LFGREASEARKLAADISNREAREFHADWIEKYGSIHEGPHSALVQVKTYCSDKEFERDAKEMFSLGWTMQGQSDTPGHVSVGRAVAFGLPFARTKDKTTVTWVGG